MFYLNDSSDVRENEQRSPKVFINLADALTSHHIVLSVDLPV